MKTTQFSLISPHKSYFIDTLSCSLTSLSLVPVFFFKYLVHEIIPHLGHYEAEQSRRLTCIVGDVCSHLYIPVCSVFITVWLQWVTFTSQSALPQIFLRRAVVWTGFHHLCLYSWLFLAMCNDCTPSCVGFKAWLQMIKWSHIILSSSIIAFLPDLRAANFNKQILYLLLSSTNVSVK